MKYTNNWHIIFRLGVIKLFLVIILFSSFQHAFGSGYAIYVQGASALGQGNAVVAHLDDPGAIFYNPALINNLKSTQLQFGTTPVYPSREFRSESSLQTYDGEKDIFFPSTIYVTHRINNKISAGLGVFNPFGLGTNWGKNWEGRYIATNSELTTFNINPVVSYQVTQTISLAAGVSLLILDALLEKRINLSKTFPGLPDGDQQFEGKGEGLGFNVGLLVDFSEDLSFGASYRSKIDIDIDGDATFSTPPAVSALFPNTGAISNLTLPQQAIAGIAYKGFQRLTFSAGLIWEGWSDFDELRIELSQPVAGSTTSVSERDWTDVFTFNTGTRYQLTDRIALLGGYLYGNNPIPDSTFEPAIPDSNHHILTLGTDVQYKQWKFDVAYAFQLLKSRAKNNDIDDFPFDGLLDSSTSANGKYSSNIHFIAFSSTYAF